jgi:Ulp1 family protease
VLSFLKDLHSDFVTGWIYDAIIDAFLLRLYQAQPHVLHADSVISSALFSDRHCERVWAGIDLNSKCMVFFPSQCRDHWVLYVADIKSETLMYLDPSGKGPGDRECQLMTLIGKLIEQQFSVSPVWKLTFPKHALQTDGINCGVLVMWYAYQLANNKSLTDFVDPNTFRRDIFHMLAGNCLRRSKFSDESCGVCADRYTHPDWIQCYQWFHCECIGLSHDQAKSDGFHYICQKW